MFSNITQRLDKETRRDCLIPLKMLEKWFCIHLSRAREKSFVDKMTIIKRWFIVSNCNSLFVDGWLKHTHTHHFIFIIIIISRSPFQNSWRDVHKAMIISRSCNSLSLFAWFMSLVVVVVVVCIMMMTSTMVTWWWVPRTELREEGNEWCWGADKLRFTWIRSSLVENFFYFLFFCYFHSTVFLIFVFKMRNDDEVWYIKTPIN